MSEDAHPAPQGVVVNARTIAGLVGIITILAALWTTTSFFQDQKYQIVRLQDQASARQAEIVSLRDSVKNLTDKITELTIAITDLNRRIEANP